MTPSPSRDIALLHKPSQLPLGEDGVLEVEATVFVDIGLPDGQVGAEPGVLGVTVVVLRGPQGVGHALNAVHNRTGKVVRGVNPKGGKDKEVVIYNE